MINPHRTILRDAQYDTLLREEGFAVIPFLDKDEVDDLVQIFREAHPQKVEGFYASAHLSDISLRKKLSENIKAILNSAFEKWFLQCKLLGGSFVVKAAGFDETLQPHQDWNIVDEKKFRSFNIWIPLIDLHSDNGTILVMPHSHRWLATYRHASIPCAFKEIHGLLLQHMKPLYLKAGEALVYDHALLHASLPNKSQEPRIACACGVIPAEAEMMLFVNHNGKIAAYECNTAYFMEENIFDSPPRSLKKICETEYDFPSVSIKDFYRLSGLPMPEHIHEKMQEQLTYDKGNEKRPFWKIYTPRNILKEIQHRLFHD
ncbi:MAG: phytanoyl-CoA dioxygenase family protein [Chitinophagales bacterium]|nr:phytanoyl-CoA dioxygenase family protein [Chitinophagales bacterium]MDW8273705.1 phytanoyl-CoA dioxygenase family protein [Chitinophagales bacterium]